PRRPYRGSRRHASVLALRQGDDGLRLRGLRDARLLAGPAPHDPLRLAARLAADLGAALAQLGVPLVLAAAVGLRQPPAPADPRRDVRRARPLLALHPPVDARGRPPALHPVGPSQWPSTCPRDRPAP